MTLVNLACGLDLDEIENPTHILRQLTAAASDKTTTTITTKTTYNTNSNGELVELANPCESIENDHEARLLLPSLIESAPTEIGPLELTFKCRCPRLSVDQQRDRYCRLLYLGYQTNNNNNNNNNTFGEAKLAGEYQAKKTLTSDEGDFDQKFPSVRREEETIFMDKNATTTTTNKSQSQASGFNRQLPSIDSQLAEFGRINRNSLAKRVVRKWCRLYGPSQANNLEFGNRKEFFAHIDIVSLCLYKMEEFLLEANKNLAEILVAESCHSSLVLEQILLPFKLAKFERNHRTQMYHLELNEKLPSQVGKPPPPPPPRLPVVMIRAPLSSASGQLARLRSLRLQSYSTKSGISLLAKTGGDILGQSRWRRRSHLWRWCDSGIDLDCVDRIDVGDDVSSDGSSWALGQLEQHESEEEGKFIERKFEAGNPLEPLQELLEFRSNSRVQSIVELTFGLFGKLLEESHLFKLINNSASSDNNNNFLFNSQELKLYACIECQKLRSSIRFNWITQCLMVAFGGDSEAEAEAKTEDGVEVETVWKQQQQNLRANRTNTIGNKKKREKRAKESFDAHRLPPIEAHKQEDLAQLKYFDSLAHLMANLLRQHFLVPALERWFRLLETHLTAPTTATSLDGSGEVFRDATEKPKLGIQVELIELDNNNNNNNDSRHELDGSSSLLGGGGGGSPVGPPRLLAASWPEVELRQTLGFVVDELASVCRRLPRLETQLESQALLLDDDDVGDHPNGTSDRQKFILTLERDDNLLVDTKIRLNHLIDRSSLPISEGKAKNKTTPKVGDQSFQDQLDIGSGSKGLDLEGVCSISVARDSGYSMTTTTTTTTRLLENSDSSLREQTKRIQEKEHYKTTKWVDSDYLLTVELVNNFRRGNMDSSLWDDGLVCFVNGLSANEDPLAGSYSSSNAVSGTAFAAAADDHDDDRLHRLQACCKQISLLNSLERRLNCQLNRFYDHGFVLLDYGRLRDSLLKYIQKERLLLIRLHLDELLRLMDRLRLQFDEIEFGVDLEAAIEDYLADRRQMKQSQHHHNHQQQQQVLHMDNDSDFNVGLTFHPFDLPATADAASFAELNGNNLQHTTGQEAQPPEVVVSSNNKQILDEKKVDSEEKDLDEFVEAITQGHTNDGHKLLALGAADSSLRAAAAAASNNEEINIMTTSTATGRQVLPIIECQLLVARYEFISELLVNELKPLAGDIRVAFEGGLVFLSEFVGHDQLDPSHWQLITELATKSSELRPLLSQSLVSLKLAHSRLCHSNELRSRAISRLALEFHRLIGELAARFLASEPDGDIRQQPEIVGSSGSGGGGGGNGDKSHGRNKQKDYLALNEVDEERILQEQQQQQLFGRRIVQLDTIQETAAWAGELELRFLFLKRQNSLLAKEAKLLSQKAKLVVLPDGSKDLLNLAASKGTGKGEGESGSESRKDSLSLLLLSLNGYNDNDNNNNNNNNDSQVNGDEKKEEDEFWRKLDGAYRARASILERWRHLVGVEANLWRLIEEYETQQVKWLNSDTKRIDFNKMDSTFKLFTKRFQLLREQSSSCVDKFLGDLLDLSYANNTDNDWILSLEHNLDELERRFDRFARKRLPLFKFLTNKYLTDEHWKRVGELLASSSQDVMHRSGIRNPLERLIAAKGGPFSSSVGGGGQTHTLMAPQACTTLAQFLELNAERHVEELESINREAILEQELTNFLLTEVGHLNSKRHKIQSSSSSSYIEKRAQLKALDMSGAWFVGWTEKQLIMAAGRFIEAKLEQSDRDNNISMENTDEYYSNGQLAAKLVACHSIVERHLKLRYEIGLDTTTTISNLNFSGKELIDTNRRGVGKINDTQDGRRNRITLRTCKQLTSPKMVTPALFVEFLRLFSIDWLKGRTKLANCLQQIELDLTTINEHLEEIEKLINEVNGIRENELRLASIEGETTLVNLERESVRLEIEREILATMESLALERQREALGKRDKCIRQITERAIPAIRAATKALDCLDARSLRNLRHVRPNPPEAVRLVLEAVCLLRSCVTTSGASSSSSSSSCKPMEPERHFDALSGRIIENYWQPANRMLNRTHSCKFIADLRRIDKRRLPGEVMQLIRRRYLSSSKFRPTLIERVSPECGLLSKWLIAVDVFDRVINVVRPNYSNYLESEKQLANLLTEVNNRRNQIETIGLELQQMEEALEGRINLKMSLADSLDQCCNQLKRIELTRTELIFRREAQSKQLERLRRQQYRLANKCLMRAAKTVYMDSMLPDERGPMASLLRMVIMGQTQQASN